MHSVSTITKISTARQRQGAKPDREGNAAGERSTPARRLVFSSVLTPNWFLGMLLFACMFMPFCKGCNDTTIYMYEALGDIEPTVTGIYCTFMYTWPFFFGLIVSVATVATALCRSPVQNKALWRGITMIIFLNAALLMLTLVNTPSDSGEQWIFVLPAIVLLLLVFAAVRLNRCWFQSAVFLQLCLAALAMVWLPFAPVLRGPLLYGGKTAVVAAGVLIITSLIEWLNARRALSLSPGQSSLNFSLKSMFAIMLIGVVVFCWTWACIVADTS